MDINFVNSDYARDTYLNNENVINRLIKDHKEYGRTIVAYDFDNTVYSKEPNETCYQIIELLKVCKEMGFILIVFTCRPETEYDFVKNFLNINNIPYDFFNCDADFISFPKNNKKIYYDIFLDDRAGLKSAYESLVGFIYKLNGGE